MLITQSGFSSRIKFLEITSSGVYGEREYIPGRSTIEIGSGVFLYVPSFLSTVTPGQFPTCAVDPVSELNNVVLPQLGFQASANLSIN